MRSAADNEADPERRFRLRTMAEAIGGVGRDAFTQIAATAISQSLGM